MCPNKILIIMLLYFSFLSSIAKENENKKENDNQEFNDRVEREVIKKLAKVTGDNLKEFAKSLLDKEKELKIYESDLVKRDQELKLIQENFQSKLKEFRRQQDRVIGCISENQKQAGKRIDHVVKVISGMKPANAAQILSVQDSTISVQIISKLDPEKVSKIFNLMDKEISARLQKSYINMKR